jgi:alpha-L-rhamnosidase
MKKWVTFLERTARQNRSWRRWFLGGPAAVEQYVVDTAFHWGEWLRPGEESVWSWIKGIFIFHSAAVPTAYLADSSRLLAQTAKLLGHVEDETYYAQLALNVKEAWVKSFVGEGGRRIAEDKQDDYARALQFKLLPAEMESAAIQRLLELVQGAGHHLGTGFLSTRYLIPTLCRFGHSEAAFRVLLQDSPPSWLYPIKLDATTIWETWPGYNDKGDAYMSHNHYAFGAISGWLIEGIVGLMPETPGWRRIRIAPQIGGSITSASATVETPFGELESKWEIVGDSGDVSMCHNIPPGTTAELFLGGKGPHNMSSGTHLLLWRKGAERAEVLA